MGRESNLRRGVKLWKTIKIGTGLKGADLYETLNENKKFFVIKRAKDILEDSAFTVASKESEVDLVIVTVAELGFLQNATSYKIYKRAKQSLGLELCPAEVGPQLRLQYENQPIGESILVAMEPIADSHGYLRVFEVENPSDFIGLRLDCQYGFTDILWGPAVLWVFVRPRK